ncbi:hypothetical protein HOT99_gp020 [Caulobacter phage CcrBL10]|uniref:Lipoprotein n=1 Tax=Caulobacter phage CcrBL10 TaxID=2283269 RepID=A0A385E8S3_9CAUD|nr:hypothetical protein HOT99_gp020 [Caulobacter phage CcrBL10]AXQ68224.1 hypothetical protein CcrBL10_gp020 [Caulobacter phage CcrBL10]
MRFFGFLLTVALVSLPFTLAACGGPIESHDEIIATTQEGCKVHKIYRSQGILSSEEVYTTICPDGSTKSDWKTTRMVGKTIYVDRHHSETPAR